MRDTIDKILAALRYAFRLGVNSIVILVVLGLVLLVIAGADWLFGRIL